jgi:hypothetical protein
VNFALVCAGLGVGVGGDAGGSPQGCPPGGASWFLRRFRELAKCVRTAREAGTLTFKPAAKTGNSATTKAITAVVSPDLLVEGDETFRVVLSEPTGGYELGVGTGVGTIIDDDPVASPPTVGVGDVSIVEGDVGVKASSTNAAKVWVSLSQPATQQVSVKVTVTAGSASQGADFKAVKTKTLVFKAGQRQGADDPGVP